MKKDFKTGLLVGLVLVVGCAIWLSTRPNLSTQMLLTRSRRQAAPPAEQGQSSVTVNHRPTRNVSPNQPPPTSPERTASPPRATQPSTSAQDNSTSASGTTAAASRSTRTHTVAEDETLSDIAREYYGSAAKWRTIYQANKATIPDPDKVSPGTKLVIP